MEPNFLKIEGFEWDKGNLKHIKKHLVVYKECEQVFFNKPLLIKKDDAHSQKEERFHAIGLTNKRRLLFIAFTMRKNYIRVISARNQNRKEQKDIKAIGGETYKK